MLKDWEGSHGLQPILMIGMLANDNVLAAAVMAVLAAWLTNRLFSEIDEFA
jgi:hypothetical protein